MFELEIRREKALFAAADALAILVALGISGFLHDLRGTPPCILCYRNHLPFVLTSTALISLWLASGRAVGLYSHREDGWSHLACIIKTAFLVTVVSLLVNFVLHGQMPRMLAGLVLTIGIASIIATRGTVRWLLMRFSSQPGFVIPIVIFGFNSFGRYLCDQIEKDHRRYQVLGFLDPDLRSRVHCGHKILGGLEQISRLVRDYHALEIAIVLPDSPSELVEEIVETCERCHARWRVMPALVRSLPSGLQIDNVGVLPLIGPRSSNIQGINYVIKRTYDVLITVVALVLVAPLMLLTAAAILLFDGRPILFRQTRVGLYGKPFQLLKFRTMREGGSDATHQAYVRQWIQENAPASKSNGTSKVFKMTADPRITRPGGILRRFSIDELPQLFNVLKGEMSLIGPRPALMYELDLYKDWHRARLAAPPGITGLWQVSGRNSLSFEEMVRLDLRYIEDWSLGQDLRIMLRTVPALFAGGGH